MKLSNIIATLENLENVIEVEAPEQAAETAVQAAELGSDMQTEVTQIDGMDTGIDDAEQAQGQLTELQTVAEDSLTGETETVAEGEVGEQGDGLTEGEAQLIEISHESIMAAIGMPVTRRKYTPESFGNKNGRREVTMEALDGLKESAKKMSAGIVRALKAALDTVVGFIAKLVNNRALMAKHLKNLEGRLNEVGNEGPKEAAFATGASTLSLNGKADAGTADDVLNAASQNLVIARKIADKLYQKKDAVSNADIISDLSSLPTNGKGHGILGSGKAFGVSDDVAMLEVLDVGGVAETIKAPTKEEMKRVLGNANKVLNELKDAEKVRSRLKDFTDAVALIAGRAKTEVTSRVGSAAGKEKGAEELGVVKAARIARKIMTKFMTTVFGNAFKVIKAAADYVNAGIKNLEASKGDAAAPAA